MNPLISKRDFVLIAIILLTGFLILGIRAGTSGLYAEIQSAHGTTRVSLKTDRVFYLPGIPNVIFEIRNGQIAFIESDCPDQICVRSGFLGRTNQTAACLPNHMLLFIQSENDTEIDIFVR